MTGMIYRKCVKGRTFHTMLDKTRKKLRGRNGESLSETLLALLISALALTMLAGAISSAANVITRGNEQMTDYYAADVAVAKHDGTNLYTNKNGDELNIKGSVTVKLTAQGGTIPLKEYEAVYYENQAFASIPVVSYEMT